jgi:hypothetical protein
VQGLLQYCYYCFLSSKATFISLPVKLLLKLVYGIIFLVLSSEHYLNSYKSKIICIYAQTTMYQHSRTSHSLLFIHFLTVAHTNNLIIIYETVSIISGTGAAIWTKTNFGPTGRHHPRSIPFHMHAPFPALLTIFKCILKVVFCTASNSASITSRHKFGSDVVHA